jgi:metal-responsive CopG/Arc/MetJ family transcriptional regulator
MKEKTSVTLSPHVLAQIDRMAGTKRSRSAVIEDVLRQFLREQSRAERRARDIAILNKYADEMKRDALDGLDEQASEEDFR